MENEEKLLFSWVAAERPHKKWSKDFYSTVIVLAFLMSVILFFIEGVMPVLVIWAIVFMVWAINRTEPGEMEYQITNWGIRIRNDLYRFEEMSQFWFDNKWTSRIFGVYVRRFPGQLIMVIAPKDEEIIKEIMVGKVVMQKPTPTWSDKLIKWFGEKVPLD